MLQGVLEREDGDVFGTRWGEVRAQGGMNVLKLLQVAHGFCGARGRPASAGTLLASQMALGGDGHVPVCNDSGSTLF